MFNDGVIHCKLEWNFHPYGDFHDFRPTYIFFLLPFCVFMCVYVYRDDCCILAVATTLTVAVCCSVCIINSENRVMQLLVMCLCYIYIRYFDIISHFAWFYDWRILSVKKMCGVEKSHAEKSHQIRMTHMNVSSEFNGNNKKEVIIGQIE